MTVWGATTYEYKCAPTKVTVARTSTSSPYKYTLTITQTINRTNTSSIESGKIINIVIHPNSQTLEGEYNNSTLTGTYYEYAPSRRATLNTSETSSFKIGRNEDGSYQIMEGKIYTILDDGNQYNFNYCYANNNSSFTKANYTFFPNYDVANNGKYTMSNINTFNAVYNSAINGYDVTFKVTGNNGSNYFYDVSLSLANAPDLLGTFRTGTATNTLMPNSTIIWTSNSTTRYPLEYTSLTISQVAPNQYKLAGKLYALKDPSGTSTPFLYDFGDGVDFEFLAEQYTFNEDGTDNPSLQEIANKRLRFDLTLSRALSRSYYNTFCSPVTIPAGEIVSLLGENAEVYTFTAVSGDAENGYTFTFSPLNGDIVAGTPYLVKPSSAITQIELTNVPTSQLTTEAQTITHNGFSFCGVLAPTNLSGSEYVLGDGDLLYKALPGQMKGMRAYFTFPAAQNGVAPRVSVKMQEQTNTPTGWQKVHDAQAPGHNGIQKILHNGQLLIRRGKVMYDIFGNKQ